MEPVNNKSLLHFVFNQMEKLDKGEISVEKAKAQSNLAKQANNTMKYELDRVSTELKVKSFNIQHGANITIRDIEAKNFD